MVMIVRALENLPVAVLETENRALDPTDPYGPGSYSTKPPPAAMIQSDSAQGLPHQAQ